MTAKDIQRKLRKLEDRGKGRFLQKFFKTGRGEYGEGDLFLGIRVSEVRKLAGQWRDLPLREALRLLNSSFHEERLLALLILEGGYARGDESAKKAIYEAYLDNLKSINSWDLVDISAPSIVGGYLFDKSKQPLYRMTKSKNLWERRISVMSTFYSIRRNQFTQTLKICRMLLADEEDLIHKAVGWMLREVGKRDLPAEENFLKKHYRRMPRTMLRYAVERFPETKRRRYLDGRI
jgi:3-methyladenine DNA glycosylase AlkD